MVSLSSSAQQRGGSTTLAIALSHRIKVIPHRPQTLPWFFKRIWRLCQLLALLTDGFVRTEQVEVRFDGDHEGFSLFYAPANRGRVIGRPSSLCFFYLANVSPQFGSIIDMWLYTSEILLEAINLFSIGRDWTDSLEMRFLLLCQSLEVYSRATSDSEYMPAESYESVKATIINSIPATVEPSHRVKLKSQITFGNEYSLRKRVENMLESLQPATVQLICVSPSKFVAGLVATRNYLTHYTDELRAEALRGSDLHWASEKIALLMRVVLLRYLGLPEEVVRERVNQHPRLAQCLLIAGNHQEAL